MAFFSKENFQNCFKCNRGLWLLLFSAPEDRLPVSAEGKEGLLPLHYAVDGCMFV